MSSNGRASVSELKHKLFYSGLSPTQNYRLRDIHGHLEAGPLTTDEIVEKCGANYGDVTELLNYGQRNETLNRRSQFGYKGRGKRPRKWSNNVDGMQKEAGKKLAATSPLDLLDEGQRVRLLEMNPAKCGINPKTEEPVTAHQLYYVAELCAAIQLFPDLHYMDVAKMDCHYSTLRNHRIDLAEHIGVVEVERPERKGVAGNPRHRPKNKWDRVDELRTSGLCLHPARSKKMLVDLVPKKNRCTLVQRKRLASLGPKNTKLSAFDLEAMVKVIFPSIGTSRITTYLRIAEELGCGKSAIEKPILRLKAKGWIEVVKNAGGHAGRETLFTPAWDRVETLYNGLRSAKAKRKAKPSANGHATNSQKKTPKRTAEKPPADQSPPPPAPKRRAGRKKDQKVASFNEFLLGTIKTADDPRKPAALREEFRKGNATAPVPKPDAIRQTLRRLKKNLKLAAVTN